MPRVLVLEPDGVDRAFFAEVLRGAGHEVVAPEKVDDVEVGETDVVISDVDIAVSSPWLAGARDRGRPRVVLVSAFKALLEGWKETTLSKPVTRETLLGALEGVAPPATVAFDWVAHDRRIARAVMAMESSRRELAHLPELVSASLQTPTFVNVVLSDEQRFVLHTELPDDLEAAGGTPQAWSLCKHVVEAGVPLVVADVTQHAALASTPLVRLGLVRAYAGVPIRVRGIGVVGTVCAISERPRKFSSGEIATLRLAAEAVAARIDRPPPQPAAKVEVEPELGEAATVPARVLRKASSADPLIGETLGDKYLVTARVGAGGMSKVYLARDVTIGNLVAVKVLRTESARALIAEAKTIAAVHHPNIVRLHGWGRTNDGAMYIVLEYIRGESLSERVRRGSGPVLPSATETLRILRAIGGALESLHGAGFVHGDVKPANVMIDRDLDRAVLVDFGLAMRLASGSRSSSGAWEAWSPSDKRSGGTPGYSAPEQLFEDSATVGVPQLDVYGLAALAYFLLIGRGPFSKPPADQGELGVRSATFEMPSVARSDLPPQIDAELRRALSVDPRERHRSPIAFVDSLEAALAGRHTSSPPSPTAPRTRGLALIRIRNVVRGLVDSSTESALAHAMPATIDPDEWYPSTHFIEYLRAYQKMAPLDMLGSAVARALGENEVTRMQIDRSPFTLIRSLDAALQRFHDWLTIEVRPRATDAMDVRFDIPPLLLPEACIYLGGIVKATVQTVRSDVMVKHDLCRARGDAACEIEVRWSP